MDTQITIQFAHIQTKGEAFVPKPTLKLSFALICEKSCTFGLYMSKLNYDLHVHISS